MEVISELKWCKRENLLSDEKIRELREYYIYGGIHKEDSVIKDYLLQNEDEKQGPNLEDDC